MTRSGYLVAGAILFALAAAGVLLWTDFLKIPTNSAPTETSATGAQRQAISPPATPETPPYEAELVRAMNDAALGGGFVAGFQEEDVAKWHVAEGHQLERFTLGTTGPAFARLKSSRALDEASVDWPNLGLSVRLPVEFAEKANGRRIQVAVVARAPQTNGSPKVSILYATQQAGNTGWRTFNLGPSFELFKFVYDVPKLADGYSATPIVVLHSDSGGDDRPIELLGIYVKIVP